MTRPVLHLDFECYAELDIRKVGLENYLRSPGFCVTVMAWAFDDGPVLSRVWPRAHTLPFRVREHIENGGEIRAHNAAFEYAVLHDHYGINVQMSQMTCTMQKALEYGLPAGLLKAGKALKLPVIKDETARLLMLMMGRPRAKGAAPWHASDPAKLARLEAYCIDDVLAERALDAAVPDLHPWEKALSELDHRINRQGIRIDRQAVDALRQGAAVLLQEIDRECAALTRGEVTRPGSQTARLVRWLAYNGISTDSVSSDMVERMLGFVGIRPDVRRVLELRQQAARSSVTKLERMLDVASANDDRARYLLQFAGAGRTLRWAGRLIQPQNLPRTGGFNSRDFLTTACLEPGALGLLWGSGAMDGISRSLRSCFVAKDNHVLVSVDLSQIEARVLAWLAGQLDVLEAFRGGVDVYVLAARNVGSQDRQLGKVLTLACGFGMGWRKFMETAAAAPYYVKLTEEQAKKYLYAWRSANPNIVDYWDLVETKVWLSLKNPGAIFDLTRDMAVRTHGGVTQIRKPNKVLLTYHAMRVEDGGLVFDGVNSTTKNWGKEKAYGGRLVENVVQAIARDVMAGDMLARAEASAVPVMTVHDEIVWEIATEKAPVNGVTVVQPPWAAGLPIACSVTVGKRYAK